MRCVIQSILSALKSGIYERDEVIGLSLLSALSGESIFLLGLPGVGKSMIARRLKLAFKDSTVFEYLMSRFSTPDEIFGPVSISKLKDEDLYERMVEGYLPDAEVVFLDEIWKAGPAIQNSLLTVLNEKIYLNGNKEIQLPVKAIIAASNELPAEDEGLEALWDRFLIRYIVEPIRQKNNFFRLLSIDSIDTTEAVDFRPLTADEYDCIRKESKRVELPRDMMELIYDLRQSVNMLPKDDSDEDIGEPEKYYVSDRRWRKITGVLRTSAYLNGRSRVDMSDMLLLEFMLWDNDGMIPTLHKLIAEIIVSRLFADIQKTFRMVAKQKDKVKTGGSYLYSEDGIYYQILCDGFVLKLRIKDYETMFNKPGTYFYASETSDGCLLLRDSGQYTLMVPKPGVVCINNYNYALVSSEEAYVCHPSVRAAKEKLEISLTEFRRSMKDNLFTSESKLSKIVIKLIDVYLKRYSQPQ